MNAHRLATMLLAMLLMPLDSAADEPKVGFDQGVDSSQIVREVRRRVPLSPIEASRVLRAQSAATTGPADKGAVIGVDVRARVDGSEPYQAALQYPPLIENLKPEVRDPLKSQWSAINTTRGELITEANGLEAEDRALASRAAALNRRTAELDQRTAQLDAEVANFNRQCTGRPLPPDEYNACVSWRNDLISRINSHNAEVQRHNAQVEQWRREASDLRRRAGTESAAGKNRKNTAFLPRVAAWEQRILQFSNAAKKALEDAQKCGPLNGLRIDPASPSDLPVSSRQSFTAIPSFAPPEDKPCLITYLWTTQNTAGNIGHLTVDPKNQAQATLNTGSDEAKGFVIVEADEVLGKKSFRASAPVKVVKGAIQCKLLTHDCTSRPPDPPPFENICNYDCCGQTVSATYLNNVCSQSVCGTRFCVP